MFASSDTRQRLRELAARITTEQDHDKFSALVQELSQLLDQESPSTPPADPAPPAEPPATDIASPGVKYSKHCIAESS
jgi:hypothetical protein